MQKQHPIKVNRWQHGKLSDIHIQLPPKACSVLHSERSGLFSRSGITPFSGQGDQHSKLGAGKTQKDAVTTITPRNFSVPFKGLPCKRRDDIVLPDQRVSGMKRRSFRILIQLPHPVPIQNTRHAARVVVTATIGVSANLALVRLEDPFAKKAIQPWTAHLHLPFHLYGVCALKFWCRHRNQPPSI